MSSAQAPRRTTPCQSVVQWLTDRGGIAHRADALEAGYTASQLRAHVAIGDFQRVRRFWLATTDAPTSLVVAATATGVLACVSAARHRGWWMPVDEAFDNRTHIGVKPHAATPVADVAVHWSRPIVPVGPRALIESVEDTLQHVADCAPRESAQAIWESAAQIENLSRDYLVRVAWTSPEARELARHIEGILDSGLESLFASRVRAWGIAVRLQVSIAGHRVDALIGDRLVVQIDGYAFHSTPADRGRDVAHDAELVARGYTVLRFTYAQVVHNWPIVAQAIRRALASRLHLAR